MSAEINMIVFTLNVTEHDRCYASIVNELCGIYLHALTVGIFSYRVSDTRADGVCVMPFVCVEQGATTYGAWLL